MLAVSPLRNTSGKDDHQRDKGLVDRFTIRDDFADFSSAGSLLDSIDFDDLFVGIDDADFLPDLEMDQEILAQFSPGGRRVGDHSTDMNVSSLSSAEKKDDGIDDICTYENSYPVQDHKGGSASDVCSSLTQEEEIVSKRDESVAGNPGEKGKKSSVKNPQGKRKVKVDWTPELHRRFVQAVEQLGVDKAVPSRILELMGIDCLTRHNIASHLQKYRSHRKHLLAREAEAVSWSQRRQIYGARGGGKREVSPWIAPTIGFPPVTPMPQFRPLHVWGHPSADQSMLHMWPKHLSPSPPHPPPAWAPHPPPTAPSFWHPHQQVPNPLAAGAPCFQPHLAPMRFPTPTVPGIPPPHAAVYKVESGVAVPTPPTAATARPFASQFPVDFHPSKESVDAAIEDVLSKPWLPLPLGLKPPLVDSVLGELHRQGVSKIPPSACASPTTT